MLAEGEEEPSSGCWSPDGQWIVYNGRGVGDELDIFLIKADGSEKRNLTNSPAEEAHPHWSPDGQRIWFNSDRATPDRSLQWNSRFHDLHSMAPDGTDVVRHTDCRGVCTNPNPSPDGRRIAFRMMLNEHGLGWSGRATSQNSDIAVFDIASGAIINLTRHPSYDTWPSWSPDSNHIVFGSNRDGVPNSGQIYMVPASGGETRRLTDGSGSFGEPFFHPDGKRLFFSKAEGGLQTSHIASMDVERN